MKRAITFGKNLRYYRTKQGLTQSQLAEQINYTEKSISKWEGGNALPTVDILVKLSQLFKVSVDELIFEKNAYNYFLGIDGGGTKTVFKLVDDNGSVISEVVKGSSNPNDIGIEATLALLKEGINEACHGVPYSKITMFAGLSGGGLTSDTAKKIRGFFSKFGFAAYDNGSDIENLVTLADSEKCVLVIMGTGFIVYALNGTERIRISGWGQFFDEGGSGYTIGRDAITAVLCASDKSAHATMLTNLIEERLGEKTDAHLIKFYQGGKRYIASFAKYVFEAAALGDRVAKTILENNMAFVAKRISIAVKALSGSDTTQKIPVMFSGGISEQEEVLFPLIEKHLTEQNCTLTGINTPQVDGAVKRARQIFAQKGE